jgi:multidrug efflux pump
VFLDSPETDFTFQSILPNSGFGGMVTKPWDERERTIYQILPEVQHKLQAIPGIRMFPVTPPALPGGGQFPVEFVLASTAETEEILGFAQRLQQKAMQSGLFAFPPLIDVKIDQPQTQLIIDRDKVADLGSTLSQVGANVGGMVGGDFVNRFDIDGRSYKVIPQIVRTGRLNPDQLQDIYVSGPDGRLVPLATVATVKDSVVPRSLNRFQQLNAIKISGVAVRPLDEALRYLEDEAAQLLPKGYVLDYTGESRQLRTEGNKFLPAFTLAIALIFLVLAAQFNSFRDPFVILAGSVPLALFGALIFTFLKMPDPSAADPDDHRRHHRRSLPVDSGQRRRRRCAQFHRPGAGRRHVRRHLLHPLCPPLDLHAGGPRSWPRPQPAGCRMTYRAAVVICFR